MEAKKLQFGKRLKHPLLYLLIVLGCILTTTVVFAAQSESELTQKVLDCERKLAAASSNSKSLEELNLALSLTTRGRFYQDAGRTELAERDFNRAVQVRPQLALGARAEFYKKLRKFDLAEADWNQAVQLDPKFALSSRAKFYQEIGKKELAEADWNAAVQQAPEYNLANRARFYEEIGKLELAETDWNAAVQRSPDDFLDDRVKFYEKIGKFELADADWTRLVQLKPAEFLDDRAAFYENIGKFDLAEADWTRAIQLAQDKTYRYLRRARLYEKIGKMELAEADWSHAVQLKTDDHLDDRAEFYKRIGKLELAEADWNRSVQLKPRYGSIGRARFYESIGKPELAEADWNRAVQLADGEYPFFGRARFYKSIGKSDLAEADCNRAVQLFGTDEFLATGTFCDRARFYADIGKLDLAEADWNQAVKLSPRPNTILYRAEFYEQVGKFDQALRDLDSIYVDGRSDCALQRALLLLRMGKKELAERDLKEIVSLRPKGYEPESLTLAKCYLVRGQPNLAVDCLNKFLKPNSYPQLVLAIAYDRMNQRKQATDLYSKFLEKVHDSAKSYISSAQECEYARQRLIALGVKPAYGPFPLASNCKQPLAETLQLSSAPMVASASSSSRPAPSAAQSPVKPSAQSTGGTASNTRVKDKWALVVGISKFADPKYNLNFAAKDAQDFYNFLTTEANFKKDHVLLLLNERATRASIMNAFGDNFLPSVSQEGDLVVVFISTHGTPAKRDKGGRNYVVAHDTQLSSLYSTGVDMDELYRRIKEGVKTDRALIVMDACFSGAGVPGAKALNLADNFDAAEAAQGCGHLVITSSSPNERSWESKVSPNGVFTKYLIQALRGNKSRDVKSAFADLQKNVAWEVQNAFGEKQTPQLGGEWEGKELILSVPSSEPRSVLNPELLREIRLAAPSLQRSHAPGASGSHPKQKNLVVPQGGKIK